MDLPRAFGKEPVALPMAASGGWARHKPIIRGYGLICDGHATGLLPKSATACMTFGQKSEGGGMSKQAMRDEAERLVKEALERKTLTVKQGKTRIDAKCRKCGAPNRVSAS